MFNIRGGFRMMFFGLLLGILFFGSALFVLLIPAFAGTEAVQTESFEGTLADLPGYISSLVTAVSDVEPEGNDFFLVGTISASDDFLQFTADAKEILLDFPLITDRQKELEEKVKAVCHDVGVKPAPYIHTNPDKIGTANGEDRLAYIVEGSVDEASKIITEIYVSTFEITLETEMRFEKNGF